MVSKRPVPCRGGPMVRIHLPPAVSLREPVRGSLALASLDRACRNVVPAFPQRSPPRLLPAAACGGLRSAPDHRTRRALLHLSHSCAPQTTHAALVTHDPKRPSSGRNTRPVNGFYRHGLITAITQTGAERCATTSAVQASINKSQRGSGRSDRRSSPPG